jgi:hypothetical protein
MRRLLGDSPPPDPAKYTRVLCTACEGTGWLMSGGDMYVVKGMSPVCSSCDPAQRTLGTHDAGAASDD